MKINKKVSGQSVLRSIVLSIFVIIFFVGIVLFYYQMVYTEKRDNIIKDGELSSVKAAERFDKYLSTNIDSIKLSAYTLDGMIKEHKSDKEIQDFLVGQSTAIKNAVIENSTGLYAYINGRFFSGTNWTPPADYNAVLRPWYIKPMENKGSITILDPYVDVQSGNTMLAIGKTLCDEKSVVSVDVSLEQVQKITEEAVRSGNSDFEMILNDRGVVVTHSDKDEIGKDYSKETKTLGAVIARNMIDNDNSYLRFEHNGSRYIAYYAEMQNGWCCVSVKNTTSVYGSLSMVLILTILIVVAIITIIGIIAGRAAKRSKITERLSKQLSSTADIYISLHEINFMNDTFNEVQNNKSEASEMIGETRDHCQQMIRAIMERFSAPSSRDAIMDFVDFSKLDERLKDRNTITAEFLSADQKWRRARYIVSGRLADGRVSNAMYLIEDIDEEKRTRDLMFDTAQQLSHQLSSIADIYTSVYDCDMINDSFSVISTTDQVIANTVGSAAPHAQQVLIESMKKLTDDISKDEVLKFVEYPNIEKNTAETGIATIEFLNSRGKWCRGRFIVSERTEDGRLSHVLWAVENIDAERKAREELTEAAQTLNYRISSISNIYMTAHEVDLMSDTFTEIKNNNKIVAEMVGESRINAQQTLCSVMENVCDPSCAEELIRFIDLSTLGRRLRRVDTITTEYMNKEKLWRRARFVVSRRDEKGRLTHVLWLTEDINNEKQERDKLLDMSERAIAASEAKSSFLSNMSHEIRTPINAVLGMNEMILRECDDNSILEYSESIRTAGTTLLGLVNDILDFSKIEAGKMEIIPVDYDLSSVINDLVNMIQTKADDKGLKLKLDICETVPKLLHGDEVRIKQVITNILTNAVKYTEKGSVTFCIRYEKIEDDPDSIMLNVSVRDTGIGIKKEDMRKLFSEFDRIEEERNRNVEGTGLGMSITQRLLEMMDSCLEVESVYELGSKFSFSIRQTVVKWEELGDYEKAYKDSIVKREKYHEKFTAPDAEVLIVDDTPMNLMVFKNLLKKTGVRIDTAQSGDEGLALMHEKKYDIIFLDHMMPQKNGIQTLHELKEKKDDPNLETPVVCLTANAISGAREKYIEAGFNDYLTKPIDSAKLEELLIEYLPDEKIVSFESKE